MWEEKEDPCCPPGEMIDPSSRYEYGMNFMDSNMEDRTKSMYNNHNNMKMSFEIPSPRNSNINKKKVNEDVEMKEETQINVNNISNSSLDHFQRLDFLAKCIAKNNLISFRNFGLHCEGIYWQSLLLTPNYDNETCLHLIARYQALSFYQYLERVFTPDLLLRLFCESPANQLPPFQFLLFDQNNETLLNYVLNTIRSKEGYLMLWKLLHEDTTGYGNTVLVYAILLEKVNFLQTVCSMLKNSPSLLTAQDFMMMCKRNQCVEMMVKGCSEAQEKYFCCWGNSDEERKKHQPYCKAQDVAKALISIKKLLTMK